jgi:radical SAM protein with 4Fe4S-binding SPASM domain
VRVFRKLRLRACHRAQRRRVRLRPLRYPEYRRGNIADTPLRDMVASPEQAKFGRDKADTLPNYCRRCEVRFACHGECPKHRFVRTPDGEWGLNYLCPAYKRFFNHVDPHMRAMAGLLQAAAPPPKSWPSSPAAMPKSARPPPHAPGKRPAATTRAHAAAAKNTRSAVWPSVDFWSVAVGAGRGKPRPYMVNRPHIPQHPSTARNLPHVGARLASPCALLPGVLGPSAAGRRARPVR